MQSPDYFLWVIRQVLLAPGRRQPDKYGRKPCARRISMTEAAFSIGDGGRAGATGVVQSRNNPPALSLDTVLGLPLVLSGKEHNHCLRAIVEAAAAEQHLQIGQVTAEINSVHILKSAVLAGIGCTVFPKAVVQHELAAGSLVAHRIGTDGLFCTLVLCASKSISLTNPKRAVAQLLIDVIGQLCAGGEWPGAVAIAHPVGSTLLEENVELG
jgi:hypothetical protein